MKWHLFCASTGAILPVGAKVRTFRGEPGELVGGTPPHKPGSTGRVLVRTGSGRNAVAEWFPSVIGAFWAETEAPL